MAQIEDVVAQLRLETARFNAALKDAEGQMGRSTTAMSGIVDGLSRRFTALGTAISAAFVPITAAAAAGVGLLALTKSVTQVGDELNRLSIQTGATVEDLSALRVAAQLNDTNISDVARSIRFLNQSLIEATQQAGDARDAYAALGISTADLAQLSGQPVKMLELVAKRLDEVTNSSNKNVIALRLMGRSASEMSAFMQDLADRGMVGLREESDRLFATWSQESARAADDFNDAMDRIRVSAGGLAKDLVVTLLPVFQRIFLAIRQVMGTTTGLDKTLGRTVEIAGELEKLNRQRGLLLSQQDKLPALLQEENLRKIKDTEAAMQALNQEAQALSKSIALATEPPGTVGFGLEPPITPPPRPTRTGALPDKDAAAKAAKAATDAERDARR